MTLASFHSQQVLQLTTEQHKKSPQIYKERGDNVNYEWDAKGEGKQTRKIALIEYL